MVRRHFCVVVPALGLARVLAAQTGPPRPTDANRSIAGTTSLSGTVESSTFYTAAQVFIRNTDKRMLYMVYTNATRFRAVALFPGNYEISAATKDLKSNVQKLTISAGQSAKVTLTFA